MAPQEMGDIAVTEIAEEPEQAARTQRPEAVTDHVPEGRAPGGRRPEQQRSHDGNGIRRTELHKARDDRDPDLEGDQDCGIDRGGLSHEHDQSRVAPDSHKVQDRASQGSTDHRDASGVGPYTGRDRRVKLTWGARPPKSQPESAWTAALARVLRDGPVLS